MAQKITSYDEFNEIINAGKTVVAYFYATWCGPCKYYGPCFEELSKKDEYEKLKFIKVDDDELGEISGRAGVKVIPAFVFYQNGKVAEEYSGDLNVHELEARIQKFDRVDTDELNDVVAEADIQWPRSFCIYKNGEMVEKY